MTTAVRTTCPYCGVGCGVLARQHARAACEIARRSGASRESRAAVLEGRGARQRRSVRGIGCSTRRFVDSARELGRSAHARGGRLLAHHSRAWARGRGVLRLRPAAHRGLLRRQQADEGIHRHREHRHELAALHGLGGRRSQARVRRGHRAGLLRGFRSRRSHRARGLEHGVVPPGAVPAHRARAGAAAGAEDRRDRSAPHADVRARAICICRCARARDVWLFAGLLAFLHAQGMHEYQRSLPSTPLGAADALAVARRARPAISSNVAAAVRRGCGAHSRVLSSCSRAPSAWSPRSRRA